MMMMPKRKRLDASSPMIIIPQDVVLEEILHKLPVKSLLRFRAVSKPWRKEIESRRFQERHVRHQQKSRDPNILVTSPILDDLGKASLTTLSLGETSTSSLSVSFENTTSYPIHSKMMKNIIDHMFVRTTRSCDGLICLYSKTFISIINPTTRWHRKLPRARYHVLAKQHDRFPIPYPGFGKDDITGNYKIVWLYDSQVFNLDSNQTNTCEVFSFGTNTWRHNVSVSCPHPVLHDSDPAQAHGSLHWFIDAVTETQVLSFHLHTETFTVMSNIPVAYAPHHRITMCTLNNRLCLSEDKGDTQTIWSFNQDNMKWNKTYSINLRSTLNCIEEEYLISAPPITSLFDNKLLIYDCSDDESKLVLYNYRLDSFSKFFTASYYLGGPISYSQSLITLP